MSRRWAPGASALADERPGKISCFVPAQIATLDEPIEFDLANSLAACEARLRALSAADGAVVGSAIPALLRSEAVSSSRIDGLALDHRSESANLEAISQAIASIDRGEPISATLVARLHAHLLEGTTGHEAGRFRSTQSWIGQHATPFRAEFIPPPAELVPALMDDLCAFAMRDDLPAVLQAAVTHAQFETILPFVDGNGRLGRIVILLVLRRRGAVPAVVPAISLALLGHQRAYIEALEQYRSTSRTPWLSLFIQACSTAAIGAVELSERIARLQETWREAASRPRRDSAAERLIELLPATPVMNLEAARSLTGRSSQATLTALSALETAGVLHETTAGRRNRVWESGGLFALMDEFERTYGAPQRKHRA